MNRQALFRALIGIEESLLAATTFHHRLKSEEMNHGAAVRIMKVVGCLIEGPIVIGVAVIMHKKNPAESLTSEFVAQIHVNAAESAHAHGIASRKYPLANPAKIIRSAVSQRNLRKHQNVPARALDYRTRQFLGEGLVGNAIGERRQVGTMFFHDPPGNEDYRFVMI